MLACVNGRKSQPHGHCGAGVRSDCSRANELKNNRSAARSLNFCACAYTQGSSVYIIIRRVYSREVRILCVYCPLLCRWRSVISDTRVWLARNVIHTHSRKQKRWWRWFTCGYRRTQRRRCRCCGRRRRPRIKIRMANDANCEDTQNDAHAHVSQKHIHTLLRFFATYHFLSRLCLCVCLRVFVYVSLLCCLYWRYME